MVQENERGYASIVFGLLSIVLGLSGLLSYIGLIFSVIGLIAGFLSLYKKGVNSKYGLALSAIGFIICILMIKYWSFV